MIKKLSLLKNEEINESKEILAFEVTKIVRGEEGAKEAKERKLKERSQL